MNRTLSSSERKESAPAILQTIAAIATGVGGGVGIVRISGGEALSIAQKMCSHLPNDPTSHRLYLSDFFDPTEANEPIDQGLVCFMRGPHSYTGEDVVELHAHGGRVNLERVLGAVLQLGAGMATPGEFTKRAFLAGKLDLTQAEAVSALVSAQSVQASRQAQRQLHGRLGAEISEIRKAVLSILASIEGSLDFPDLEEDRHVQALSIQQLTELQQRLTNFSRSFSQGGKALSQGIEIALFGKTNAGKSSLINALCEQERVLVDAAPGTTRDFVEIRTHFDEIPITLIDTAGHHFAASTLEKAGLRLAAQRGKTADVVLLVVDGVVGLAKEDSALLENLNSEAVCILVCNKMDKQGFSIPTIADLDHIPASFATQLKQNPDQIIPCSALCGFGLSALRTLVLKKIAPHFGEESVIMSARQATLISNTAHRLHKAILGLTRSIPLDMVCSEIRSAASCLGEVTGDEINESMLNEIFSQFCIGK